MIRFSHPVPFYSMYHSLKLNNLVPVYACITVGSLIIAVWTGYIDPVINPDGVIYVLTANTFLSGNFQDGFVYYKWPLYPLTIAAISKIIHLPAEYSALLFNAVMRAVGGMAFIKLSEKLGADRVQLWLAGFVYLFFPGLNEAQSMIIRDFAYLACFLWMVVFFVQYCTRPNSRDLAAFVIMGLLATAYRIEGMIYLGVILIWILIFSQHASRWLNRKLAGIATLIILSVLAYGALYWMYGGKVSVFWQALQTVLQSILEKESPFTMALTTIVKAVFNFAEVLTVGYALILIAGWFVRPWMDGQSPGHKQVFQAWKIVVFINLFVLILFTLVFFGVLKFSFTDRYPLSLALMIMLFVPFAITALCRTAQGKTDWKTRIACIATGFVLLINSVEGLDRFTSKHHLRDAGTWVRQQSGGDYRKSRIYSNDRIVDYYAGQHAVRYSSYYSYYNRRAFNPVKVREKLQFLVLNLDKYDKPQAFANIRSQIGREPDRIFENSKGDKVLVYDFTDADR